MPTAIRSSARAYDLEVVLARFCDYEALPFAIEKLDGQFGLERLHLMAHCALRDASSSAARVKLSCRAAASKAFRAFNGGSRGRIVRLHREKLGQARETMLCGLRPLTLLKSSNPAFHEIWSLSMSTLILSRCRRFRLTTLPPDFINEIPDQARLLDGTDGQAGRPEAGSAGRSTTSPRTSTSSMTSA